MSDLPYRTTSKKTSIRTRFKSLTTHEQNRLRLLKKSAMIMMGARKASKDVAMKAFLEKRILFCIALSINIKADNYEPIPRPIRMVVSIDNMDFSFAHEFLRFRLDDLRRLYRQLRFPDVVKLENRSTMTGEEVFIRGLFEMVTGVKKTMVSETFGRHPSDQCRAFNYFIKHIYNNFHHLITDNLRWWFQTGLMEYSAELIETKMGARYPDRFACFIDCNCLRTDRPGGGPQEDGEDAERWDNDVQRAFYNGWKSIHGLKHQTVDNALGFTIDIFGASTFKR